MSKERETCSDSMEQGKLKAEFDNFEEDREQILKAIRDKGLIVSGDIGSGKTILAQVFACELKRQFKDKLNIGVFDGLGVWLHAFYVYYDGFVSRAKIDHLNHHSTRFWRNDERTVFYHLGLKTSDLRRSVIRQILEDVYERQQILFNSHCVKFAKSARYFYVNEESQTTMSTYSIRKSFLQTYYSTSRNFHISNMAICQRLSEISPKIREKIPNHAFGFTRGSNNLRHIRDITDKETRELVKNLSDYEFILFINDKRYKISAQGIETNKHGLTTYTRIEITDALT